MNFTWREATGPFPPGCARAWHAVEGNLALAAIMQTMSGGKFMLVYRMADAQRSTVEHFDAVTMAIQRANQILSTAVVVPRQI